MNLCLCRGLIGSMAVAGMTVVAGLQSMPSVAQETGQAAAGSLEEIVVTARKREESLQEVPLAIQAFSGERLREQGVDSLRDLSTITNGLVMTDLGAEAQSSPIIRGISQTNILRNGENNVSSFIDGVYLYNLNSINISLLDLQRVEVVKGPVSALYGRNSFAGAINYITRKPSLTDFEAQVEGNLGSEERQKLVGAVSMPLSSGAFALRLAAVYDSYGGSHDDGVNGKELGGFDKRGAQLGFLAKPTEAVSLSGVMYYGDDEFTQAPASYLNNNCAVAMGVARKYCGEIPAASRLREPEAVTLSAIQGVGNDRKVLHGNLHVDVDFGAWALESVTGYNKVDSRYFSEFNKRRAGLTYTVLPSLRSLTANTFFGRRTDTEDFSQEIRFASSGDTALRWQVGAFYYKLDLDTAVLVGLDASTLGAAETLAGPAQRFTNRSGQANEGRALGQTEQVSGFVVLDYDFSDALTGSAEARYTMEDKFFNQISLATGGADIDGSGRDDSWSFLDSRFTLKYALGKGMNLYASAAKGTKAGGFNDSATVPEDFTFDPESNWTYEIGAKSTFLDNRLQLNAAVFLVDWSGPQLQRPSSDP
jgi:iron complex outermembrane recepter protein